MWQEEELLCRKAVPADLNDLMHIETVCFAKDRLSKRSFTRHIASQTSDLYVVETTELNPSVFAYGLVFYRKGSDLARLYSLAVLPLMRGLNVATILMRKLEDCARERDRLFMRLEVGAGNCSAIRLYKSCGYQIFGEYADYYEDRENAYRMQKRIKNIC